MAIRKSYLGDGVFLTVEDGTMTLILTTEDGETTTNRIALGPEVLAAFVDLLEIEIARRLRATWAWMEEAR